MSSQSANVQSAHFRSYLLWAAASFACAALAATALVVVVDPYRLYRLVERPGFNAVKPGLTRHQEEIKVAQALARRPRVLILGNSRAEIGFNPAVLAALPGAGQAYNLAIPGTGLSSSRAELRRLLDAGLAPATVIVGVEFLDFLGPAGAPRSAAPAAAAPAPAGGGLSWRFDTLFSLASLKDAARTLLIQHDGEAVTLAPDGFNPLLEYRAHARRDGYHLLFEQAADATGKRLRAKLPAAVREDDYLALRALLSDALGAGAEVELLVYPLHPRMMALFEENGLMPLFEQWKAGLVAEAGRARAAYPGVGVGAGAGAGRRVSLVDFSGYGPYNCESVPAKHERNKATQWYWEAGHFKQELGALVLARLMAAPAPGASGFGTDLDQDSLAANRARIAAERSGCAAAKVGQ